MRNTPEAAVSDRTHSRAYHAGGAAVLVTVALIPLYRLQQLSWAEATAAAVTFVLPCVLLGCIVWRILTRRSKAQSLAHALALHIVTATVFSVAWTLPLVALVYLLRKEVSSEFLSGGAMWQLMWGFVIYCVLLLAARAHQRLRDQESAAATAELQALRAQLDPHFLFNTLHSLTQLAREDPVATQDALQRFGELMRYVLRSGRETGSEVSLEQELEFVRHYLALDAHALDRARDLLVRPPSAMLNRIFARDRHAVVPILLQEVERIEAQDDYVLVHTARRDHLLSLRIGELETRLPNPPFTRVHRSHIVNLDHVECIVGLESSRFEVRMKGGAVVPVSRVRSQQIRQLSR